MNVIVDVQGKVPGEICDNMESINNQSTLTFILILYFLDQNLKVNCLSKVGENYILKRGKKWSLY